MRYFILAASVCGSVLLGLAGTLTVSGHEGTKCSSATFSTQAPAVIGEIEGRTLMMPRQDALACICDCDFVRLICPDVCEGIGGCNIKRCDLPGASCQTSNPKCNNTIDGVTCNF
jgi:hypothetical protein